MAAWEVVKNLDLTFDEIGPTNLDKIINTLSSADVEGILQEIEYAKKELTTLSKGMELALAIATDILNTALNTALKLA